MSRRLFTDSVQICATSGLRLALKRATRAFTLCAGLAVAVSGCEILPDPEFAALKDVLTLTIVEAERGDAGGSVDVTFRLTNRGSTSATACLGSSRRVSYQLPVSGGVSSSFVDHPECMREFTIQSGGEMAWSETLEVPRLSHERVELEVDIQIVNPRRCGRVGCAAFDLSSNRFEVP